MGLRIPRVRFFPDGSAAPPVRPACLFSTGPKVNVRAVRRGEPLRDLRDGSGALAGLLLEVALKLGALGVSRVRNGWTVGVLSVDEEPWAGQRILYREKLAEADPSSRLEELKVLVEHGELPVPPPRNWRLRREPEQA